MRLPFQSGPGGTAAKPLRQPEPSIPPKIAGLEIAAAYQGARTGGDFYDFVATPSGHLLFIMMDIAGPRGEALDIAAELQQFFRQRAAEKFSTPDGNDANLLTDLIIEMNRQLIAAAGGVRCAPTFIASYDPRLGGVFYINAGHTPAVVRDGSGVSELAATGLPLGLFSHATHDAQMAVLEPASARVVVSKGLVETRARDEFGLEKVKEFLAKEPLNSAEEVCFDLLKRVQKFLEEESPTISISLGPLRPAPNQNDVTTLTLLRR